MLFEPTKSIVHNSLMTKYLTYYITYLLKKVPNISIFQKEFTIKSLDKKKGIKTDLTWV